MSSIQRKLFWPAIVVVGLAFIAVLWASTWTRASSPPDKPPVVSPVVEAMPKNGPPAPRSNALRSRLNRQPQVSKLRDIVGRRLKGKGHATSVLVGVLTTGADEYRARILRRQGDDGEIVEVALSSSGPPLTWSAESGVTSARGNPSENERLIVERLTLDSPDQFVLAQLRGASYYTVGHNVRPAEAGGSDGYTGPLWDIVRIGESGAMRAHSPWRLFYLNTRTGLIDNIVSPEGAETIIAELTGWTDVEGERVPARITWTRQGQVVMQFRLTNFSKLFSDK